LAEGKNKTLKTPGTGQQQPKTYLPSGISERSKGGKYKTLLDQTRVGGEGHEKEGGNKKGWPATLLKLRKGRKYEKKKKIFN